MKIKFINTVLLISTLFLTACNFNTLNNDDGKSDNTNKNTSTQEQNQNQKNQSQYNQQKTTNNQNFNNYQSQEQENSHQITPREAEKIVHDDYINEGASEMQVFNFKTNKERSNSKEFYIEYLARDAAGYPLQWCAIVDKNTGSIKSKFNDMNEQEKRLYKEHQKESPMYPDK